MLPLVRALTALLLVCQIARADEAQPLADDPDLELARRYYDEGAGFYEQGHYQEAIARFEKARSVKAAPGLDFNIARSYDRLGNIDQALAAYRRYLDTNPKDAADIRARITVLEERAAALAKPAVVVDKPPPKKKRAWVYAVAAVAAVAVVGVAVGVGVGLGVKPADPSPQLGAIHW